MVRPMSHLSYPPFLTNRCYWKYCSPIEMIVFVKAFTEPDEYAMLVIII